MRPGSRALLGGIVLGVLATTGASAETGAGAAAGPSLDQLLDLFDADEPEPEGSVRLDAWVEGPDGEREMIIVVEPEGKTKLVADPGITVTATAQPGVEWRVPLPHRLIDPEREYFDPPVALRLPFSAQNGQPIEVLVEYAYCVVDYQCFFGEETLTVANVVQ